MSVLLDKNYIFNSRIIMLILALLLGSIGVNAQNSLEAMISKGLTRAEQQYLRMAWKMRDSSNLTPRSYTKQGKFQMGNKTIWTSGFFPGTLWYLYEASRNDSLRYYADRFTRFLEPIQWVTDNHDIGFIICCSYGNGYRLTKNADYLSPILNAASSLSKRFNPTVGCIRSWGKINDKSNFRVIIDNMMNLELLEYATKLSLDQKFDKIARSHATTTMKNHFRKDYSCYHVVWYNQENGGVFQKKTHQGYADESAWSRGQGWALYGFTMMYRETGEKQYLRHAEKVANYLLNELNMNSDCIPIWDFDAPDKWQERDASAGAIMASAFLELSSKTHNKKLALKCQRMAIRQLKSLTSDEYLARIGENGNFVLMHSVSNRPKGKEVDQPLTYADYYYVEALLRLKKMISENKIVTDC